jgi:hypothetical protein
VDLWPILWRVRDDLLQLLPGGEQLVTEARYRPHKVVEDAVIERLLLFSTRPEFLRWSQSTVYGHAQLCT